MFPTPSRAVVESRPRIELLESRIAPASFTVTTKADTGPGSLRDAIDQANAAAGADDIVIAIKGKISLQSDLPAITDSLTITGPTKGKITIDGKAHAIFDIEQQDLTPIDVVFKGLTITNGRAENGGGIAISAPGGTVTVDSVVLSKNRAMPAEPVLDEDGNPIDPGTTSGEGGAIFLGAGNLIVKASKITGNKAISDVGLSASGGGIFIESGATATITSTLINNNLAIGADGTLGEVGASGDRGDHGDDGENGGDGTDGVDGEIGGIGGSAYGGGIYAAGTLVLKASTVSGNTAIGGDGGAGGHGGNGGKGGNAGKTVRMYDEVQKGFAGEGGLAASGGDGGAGGDGGGGGIFSAGTVTIESSTISGNTARSGSGGAGGAAGRHGAFGAGPHYVYLPDDGGVVYAASSSSSASTVVFFSSSSSSLEKIGSGTLVLGSGGTATNPIGTVVPPTSGGLISNGGGLTLSNGNFTLTSTTPIAVVHTAIQLTGSNGTLVAPEVPIVTGPGTVIGTPPTVPDGFPGELQASKVSGAVKVAAADDPYDDGPTRGAVGDGGDSIGGGVFFNSGQLSLSQVTIAKNIATTGGGLFAPPLVDGEVSPGTVTIANSTIAYNLAKFGAGIYAGEAVTAAVDSATILRADVVNLISTIVAGNTLSRHGAGADISGIVSANHSLVQVTLGSLLNPNHSADNIVDQLAKLRALTPVTNSVSVILPKSVSPAIDHGALPAIGTLDLDARGIGFTRVLGSAVDIGAVEVA